MAYKVEFTKNHNEHPVSKKGDVKSVSDSIYKDLKGRSIIKDFKQKKSKSEAFVGAGQFNENEKKKLEDYQAFGGLELDEKPQINDTVTYDGETYKVQRYTKLGTLWTVYGRISRHSGRPKK